MSAEFKYGLSELLKKDALKTKIKKTTLSRLWKKNLMAIVFNV